MAAVAADEDLGETQQRGGGGRPPGGREAGQNGSVQWPRNYAYHIGVQLGGPQEAQCVGVHEPGVLVHGGHDVSVPAGLCEEQGGE